MMLMEKSACHAECGKFEQKFNQFRYGDGLVESAEMGAGKKENIFFPLDRYQGNASVDQEFFKPGIVHI